MAALFANRTQAGQALVAPVRALGLADPVVLALPRGGVPVALELARALQAPLDLLLVRKIGAPGQPELAVAAVIDGTPPEIVLHEATRHLAGVNAAYIAREAERELVAIRRRRRVYLQAGSRSSSRGAT
jgi:putative phosphoribosyl transferase